MDSFIKLVAEDLHHKLDGHFERLTVVFPNKRASLFFRQALEGHLQDRPMWLPRFTTLNDLFAERSALTQADQLMLVCQLYQSFLKVSGRTLSLDKFYSWGCMMLSDFDDIDNNLIDASKLFQNLSDLNALTDFSFLTKQQVEAIRQLFSGFDPLNLSALKTHFLQFWNVLLPVYEDFRQALQAKGLAYGGMLRRDVIEQLPQLPAPSPTRVYAFVGFNILTLTERRLCQHLRDHADTFFYWDYDNAYMDDSMNEAAHFIRQNIEMFGSAFPASNPCYNNLTVPKEITCVAVPTDEAQAHYVTGWLNTHVPLAPPTETAVVLADERLLAPLTHTIPDNVPVNVTMGFPLSQTVVASWLRLLLGMQQYGFADARHLRGSVALRVLRHPYTQRVGGEEATEMLRKLQQTPIPYPAIASLGGGALGQLFCQKRQNSDLLQWLLTLLEQLGATYADTTRNQRAALKMGMPQELTGEAYDRRKEAMGREGLAAESVFSAYTMVSRLLDLSQTGLLVVQPASLMRLVLQMVNDRAIPYHGEPAEGVQVMGMLETRNLDFQNVILLSMDEANLPKNERQPSFIPYSLREAYGLTTVEHRTSMAAYYFYRLIQRARHITVMYNSTADGLHAGEPSRFIYQLMLGVTPSLPIKVKRLMLTAANTPSEPRGITIAKTADMVDRLKDMAPLSPSALNTYIDCPLRFYYQYIERLRTTDYTDEEVGADVFGTIFHAVMERIYQEIFPLRTTIQSEQLLTLSANSQLLGQMVDQAFALEYFHTAPEHAAQLRFNGDQRLKREVILRFVRNQLRYDATLCPLTVLDVEYKCHHSRIDRIDRVTIDGKPQLRVVDYKTGTRPQTMPKDLCELFCNDVNERAYHVFQILYYAHLLTDADECLSAPDSSPDQGGETIDFTAEPLAPFLMYPAKAFSEGKAALPYLKQDKECITDYCGQEVSSEFKKLLNELRQELLNPDVPFTQAENASHCNYCPFVDICHRPH